jgi:hypothetical protein
VIGAVTLAIGSRKKEAGPLITGRLRASGEEVLL